jgi:hypothetical protein
VALCLWLGDNDLTLSMVKRAQYSNRSQSTSEVMQHACQLLSSNSFREIHD